MSIKKKLLLLGLASYAYGNWERKQYELKNIELKNKKVKNPIRILHISDLHFHEIIRKRYSFIKRLADLEPDLIINTGDNLASADGFRTLKKEIMPIMHSKGVFVLGANDYYNRKYPNNPIGYFFSKKDNLKVNNMPTDDLELFFEKHKWLNLTNTSKDLIINGTKIHLEGVGDSHIKFDNYKNVKKSEDADLNIGITHSPYKNVLQKLSHNDIIFAGHTHGGQIRLPKIGSLVTNSDIENKFAAGFFKLKDIIKTKTNAYINISNGMGTSKFFKFRINCKPSATLLTIK